MKCVGNTLLLQGRVYSPPYVIKAMGEQAARRYFVTAERFDAAEAWRLGLVHELAATEGDLDALRAMATDDIKITRGDHPTEDGVGLPDPAPVPRP